MLKGNEDPLLAGLTALTVIVAGALFTPTICLGFGLLGSAGVYLVGGIRAPWFALSLPAITGVVAWLAFRPLYGILQLSCQQCARATMLSEELRDQRGKLNRTIKDLDASYQLLQQTNRQLALARREAEELRLLRHNFATNLSHELRTPLNIILGFVRLIYLRPDLYGYSSWREPLLKDLAEIRRSADYLSELVSDVVDLARADAFTMPLQRQMTDLTRLIDESVALARSLAKDKQVTVTAACAPVPEVYVDPMRVQQILFNLLSNAVRFTEAGSISVKSEQQGAEVIVSVADTGRGIPENELTSIFNEFYQVGRPKSDPDTGKGLGLAIAKRLVQLHGGRIWAESTPGQGSGSLLGRPTW
jgi:signal transduction histidine kinase